MFVDMADRPKPEAHLIVVTPHIRPDGTKHPNAFDARFAVSDVLLCTSETPFLDGASAGWERLSALPTR